MKEKIETKVHEILDYILAKDASQISYNEYKILDNKLKNIRYDDEKKEKEMALHMADSLSDKEE